MGPSTSNSGYCRKENEGLSLDHQGNEKLPLENLSSKGKESFGIQKIVPPDYDVSVSGTPKNILVYVCICLETIYRTGNPNYLILFLQFDDDYWFTSDRETSITDLWGG